MFFSRDSRVFRVAFPLFLFLILCITVYITQQQQTFQQHAQIGPNSFLATFDGAPTLPQPFTQSALATDWDVAVQSRDTINWLQLTPMESHHSANCSAPISADGMMMMHHNDGNYANAVFLCRDHVMTAIRAGLHSAPDASISQPGNIDGYGLLYLTPNQMVDFSQGEAVIKVDVSTLRTSMRDWWDIWVTPFEDNLQLPFDAGDVDLQGTPKRAVHVQAGSANGNGTNFVPAVITNFSPTTDFKSFSSDYNWYTGYESFMTTSPSKRTTFELRISKTHIKFGIPAGQIDATGKPVNNGNAFWWVDKDIAPLDWDKGIVQFGHHSYNPSKDCTYDASHPYMTCYANTWHWDNVSISPSLPFSIIKADRRYVSSLDNTQSLPIRFTHPAPANSYVRFSAIGTIQISFDNGATWTVAPRQPSSFIIQNKYHPDHLSNYFIPVTQGTQALQVKFASESWYQGPFIAKDFALWSKNTSSAPISTISPTNSALTSKIYWGATVKGQTLNPTFSDPPWDLRGWDLFETHTGKKMSLLNIGNVWWNCENSCGYKSFNYQKSQFDVIRNRGAIPFFTWQSKALGDTTQPDSNFQLADIYNGHHDTFLRKWAEEAAAWGHPFFMRLDWEMNGSWYMWSEKKNGNLPGDYIKMWRHVWNVINCVDDSVFHPTTTCIPAHNVTWVWNINADFPGSQPLDELYPGDNYVDWIGIDAYNSGTDPAKPNVWKSFTQTFQPTYDHLQTLAPSKPIIIAETASTEIGGSKATWITDMLTHELPQNFPNIKAFMWFNWEFPETNGIIKWQIESSSSSQEAFKIGIASSYYSANDFASLGGTKILPLPGSFSPLLGDATSDGRVDSSDYDRWKCEFLGKNTCSASNTTNSADFNRNGSVDILDFLIWINHS